jgi:anti-sigma-K factor RskA
MAADHERYEQDVGAYLLGALSPLEAEVFERHLMGCEDCQAEIERLRPAAEALPRSVESFEPPPSLKRSLMEVVEAEARTGVPAPPPQPARSRRSWLAGLRPRAAIALASVALLAGVVIGAGLIAGGGSGDTDVVTATVDRTRLPGASARVEIADDEGKPATLHVSGVPLPPRGEVYEVWVERDGEVRPAGALFEPGRDGRGAAAIPGGVKGVKRVMVTREVAGGSDHPTEMPVIVADL